jgi:peptide deformylase
MPEDVSPFIVWPDPRLATAATPRPVDADLLAIGAALLRAAEGVSAYGLAAAHIGEVAPVAVISLSDPSTRSYRLLYNPRIIAANGPQTAGKEGSVSMPGIEIDVVRPETVRIGFDDEEGAPEELDLSGFPARVAQHEIDQVNGVFFLARLSRLKREAAIKRFAKLERRTG